MQITTPLTYNDAAEMADEAMRALPLIGACDRRILRAGIIVRLIAVDVASREQAREPIHDESTCNVCQSIRAKEAAQAEAGSAF